MLKINSIQSISSSQSDSKTGDSCINQLLSIIHEIYGSFDEGLEVRSVFLDILKGFDKVLHDGIIFKLTQNGISGNLLNEKMSMLEYLKVPHTCPLLFLIYINDLTKELSSNAKLFVDVFVLCCK